MFFSKYIPVRTYPINQELSFTLTIASCKTATSISSFDFDFSNVFSTPLTSQSITSFMRAPRFQVSYWPIAVLHSSTIH